MHNELSRVMQDFDHGRLSRRQMISRMTALLAGGAGIAGAMCRTSFAASRPMHGPINVTSTFDATDLNHIALNVTDVQRSRKWYEQHLGLRVMEDGGDRSCFLTTGRGWVALFRSDTPGLDHYCYSVDDYVPGKAVKTLDAAGLSPRRRGNRVYFDDPDGIECQVAAPNRADHEREPEETNEKGTASSPTFQAVDLNHIALRVTDVQRSQQWYEKHLDLKPMGQSGFVTTGRGWLALFSGKSPGLDHYCFSIDGYDPGKAVETLEAAGLTARRRGGRVYFDDPDGIECQVAQANEG